MKHLGPVDLLIIQGSPFCNIDCKYCYLPNRRKTEKITVATVKKCIDRIIDEGLAKESFSIVWHAGEPLAMPLEFYTEISEYIISVSTDELKIKQFIQTNALLITQKWCDLFKKYDFNIGVSIDGPKFLHDKNRVTRSSKGTFDKVMAGVSKLKKNNIEFTCIAVVTSEALKFPEDMHEFFVNLGVRSLGLNIDEQVGDNLTTSINKSNIEDVRNFWNKIYRKNKYHFYIFIINLL